MTFYSFLTSLFCAMTLNIIIINIIIIVTTTTTTTTTITNCN